MHAPTDMPDSGWPVLDDLVTRVLDARRATAAAQAAEAQLLAEAVDIIADRTEQLRQEATASGRRQRLSDADLPLSEVSLELGAAMRVSDRTVQTRISDAYLLTAYFARTFDALACGDIDAAHAAAIVHAGGIFDVEAERLRYEELALQVAATESPARMNAAAKAIAATIRPDLFEEQARAASDERTVRLYDLELGQARLIVDGPAPLIHAVYDRLTAMGRAVLAVPALADEVPDAAAFRTDAASDDDGQGRRADAGREPLPPTTGDGGADAASGERVVTGPSADAEPTAQRPDPRLLDQVRTDLLCELLLTGAPASVGDSQAATLGAIQARIQVTVPALTLAGDLSGGPALLAGYGPVEIDLARRLAGLASGWDRVFTKLSTGEPVAVDRYRPNAQLKRYLAARDEHCRAPGCRRRVHQSDLDHTIPASRGGPTDAANLCEFCRRHHVLKHHTGWRVRQLGHGVVEWVGPTGRRYLDRPPAMVRFVPSTLGDAPF